MTSSSLFYFPLVVTKSSSCPFKNPFLHNLFSSITDFQQTITIDLYNLNNHLPFFPINYIIFFDFTYLCVCPKPYVLVIQLMLQCFLLFSFEARNLIVQLWMSSGITKFEVYKVHYCFDAMLHFWWIYNWDERRMILLFKKSSYTIRKILWCVYW